MRCIAIERTVKTIDVVIGDVVPNEASQMVLVEHDHVMEERLAEAADPSFGYAVLPRALECGALHLHAHGLDGAAHFGGECAVAIAGRGSGTHLPAARLSRGVRTRSAAPGRTSLSTTAPTARGTVGDSGALRG